MNNKTIISLRNPDHWKWKTNKHGRIKMHIRGKLKKWLKKTCVNKYVIIRGETPPILWITDEDCALLFQLTWG